MNRQPVQSRKDQELTLTVYNGGGLSLSGSMSFADVAAFDEYVKTVKKTVRLAKPSKAAKK